MENRDREQLRAEMEGALAHSMKEYFDARPQLMATISDQKKFEAGFDRGFWAAVKALEESK